MNSLTDLPFDVKLSPAESGTILRAYEGARISAGACGATFPEMEKAGAAAALGVLARLFAEMADRLREEVCYGAIPAAMPSTPDSRELAERAGMTMVQYHEWRSKKGFPEPHFLLAMADVLDDGTIDRGDDPVRTGAGAWGGHPASE